MCHEKKNIHVITVNTTYAITTTHKLVRATWAKYGRNVTLSTRSIYLNKEICLLNQNDLKKKQRMGLQSVGLPMQFIYLHLRNSFLMHFQNVPKASSCVNIRWHCRCCAIFFQFNVNLVHIKRYKFRHYQWAYNKNSEYI